MSIYSEVNENLQFLVSEVSLQVTNLQLYLKNPSNDIAKHILDRSGYLDNLKVRIQNTCNRIIATNKEPEYVNRKLKALDSIASSLTEIAELCGSCVSNIESSNKNIYIYSKKYDDMLSDVKSQISIIEPSIYEDNTQLALKIGQINNKFKKINQRQQRKYISQLSRKKSLKKLMTFVNVMNTLTQMGKLLLNISETIISSNLGKPVSTQRYNSLNNTIKKRWGLPMDQVNIVTIAETRSGSGISGISTDKKTSRKEKNNPEIYDAIFKEGEKKKVKEEKDKVENWHEIYPGLAPQIIDYQKLGSSASILIEHLSGYTYEKILLTKSRDLLNESRHQLFKILKKIWKETYTPDKISAGYITQLNKRIDAVYSIHPEFIQLESTICGYSVVSFNTLLKQAAAFEKKYAPAPFSVYIHGDLNVDNIIYDSEEKKINFIDLHRSQYMDYIQDISVFMVSNYRLQVLDQPLRRRILETALIFYHLTKKYAKKMNDDTFDIRLALGLARSFITSTRFILDKTLAQAMFIRSRYLIESVLKTPRNKLSTYKLPIKDIFTG
ncbi:MAG: aminoglycoside phosphotransferase family protein [gamma proteobacterium symbiont of Bathyaustriella thionipta]|nr:aminoglycoside phosphotransferase family protein [gamma proteobacterium symbiont of Bathyaustriella thionipta]MCU7950685.1 aminoglycoside phosphotransferase family protein [gamma proteobacterium symbiont of Bathyaustriella thionipta]MCU7952603.1 aminoglycoside phosphotransferase family protein [gamma proteobacterium symbiont of Bathyaustriella thionipta]MCU7957181.1 aminoglycoside phosphotransferase family protein [gamma proteobacterium symbiont of Bathyaustriella thionipta]MCU7968062.1 amin